MDQHTSIEVIPSGSREVEAKDFLPVFTVEQAVQKKNMMNQFVGQVLKEDEDYGKMPGGQQKKVLLKPGAEKLCSIFGMAPQYLKEVIVEDWTGHEHGGEPLFSYEYRCQLYRSGRFMGEAIGSCNSWESKYRYRWVSEDIAKQRPDFEQLPRRGGQKTMFEPNFALDKAETTGKYGKPAEYWEKWRRAAESGEAKSGEKMMGQRTFQGYYWTTDETQYRIPNPESADIINTCQKMAQKRALVAAVLVVTNCSDAFTQDVEDFESHDAPVTTQAAPVRSGLPSGRDVPEELRTMCDGIMKDSGMDKAGEALRFMKDYITRVAGKEGTNAYLEIADKFNAQRKGKTKTKGEIIDALLDVWEVARRLESKKAAEDDSDRPF